MELDRAGASALVSSPESVSVSEEPDAGRPDPLCREDPDVAVLLFPLPDELLPLPVELPASVDVLPLPDAAVTMVAFISVLFPAV